MPTPHVLTALYKHEQEKQHESGITSIKHLHARQTVSKQTHAQSYSLEIIALKHKVGTSEAQP